MLDGAPGMGDEAQEMQRCAPGICDCAPKMRRGARETVAAAQEFGAAAPESGAKVQEWGAERGAMTNQLECRQSPPPAAPRLPASGAARFLLMRKGWSIRESRRECLNQYGFDPSNRV